MRTKRKAEPTIAVHDHFDGSAYCVECGGDCNLTGSERAVTDLVRWILESEVRCDGFWIPPMMERALKEHVGFKRLQELRTRAKSTRL